MCMEVCFIWGFVACGHVIASSHARTPTWRVLQEAECSYLTEIFPGSAQGHARQGLEQPGTVEGRGMRWSLRSLPNQTSLRLSDHLAAGVIKGGGIALRNGNARCFWVRMLGNASPFGVMWCWALREGVWLVEPSVTMGTGILSSPCACCLWSEDDDLWACTWKKFLIIAGQKNGCCPKAVLCFLFYGIV